jgi:hypothetical protein
MEYVKDYPRYISKRSMTDSTSLNICIFFSNDSLYGAQNILVITRYYMQNEVNNTKYKPSVLTFECYSN